MSEFIDNRARRIETLKHIIRDLHQGASREDTKKRLAELVRQCDAGEIAAMETRLMEEGMPAHEIMGMCDVHAEVVRDVLVERRHSGVPSGHPIDVFRRENEALRTAINRFRECVDRLAAEPETAADESMVNTAKLRFNDIMDVEKHYARKENLLFACLERHGIAGPSTVMWGKDDEVRALLQKVESAMGTPGLGADDWEALRQSRIRPALEALDGMIDKEERVLFPMALQTLTEAEWGEIHAQSPEFGWCLIEPDGEYKPPHPERPPLAPHVEAELERAGVAIDVLQASATRRLTEAEQARQRAELDAAQQNARGTIIWPSGSLSIAQLKAMLSVLPIDLTFVDAEDRVRFFTEGQERIFPRPRAIIGRKVQHCHPPSSVDVVERILDDFHAGRQEVADFWLNFQNKFIMVRYFAVRDDAGEYLGCLEFTQDLTRLRALDGERRILQYD